MRAPALDGRVKASVLRLTLPEGTLDVALLRRVRKTIGIRIVSGRVEVTAPPGVSLTEVQAVLERKRDWIARHWRRQTDSISRPAAAPDALLLQGERIALLPQGDALRKAVLTSAGLLVGGEEAQARRQVADFLLREARTRLPGRLARMAPQAAGRVSGIALSNARTRWGSCRRDGMIRLNWRLVQAPLAILDYVIAHELAHLRHMDHSQAFWAETARLFPEWRQARTWLKENGQSLFIFG